jgi:hypothetical protein
VAENNTQSYSHVYAQGHAVAVPALSAFYGMDKGSASFRGVSRFLNPSSIS